MVINRTRRDELQLHRTTSAGKNIIAVTADSELDTLKFVKRSNETNGVEFIQYFDYNGPNSDKPENPAPKFRLATPPTHFHCLATEEFQVIQGSIGVDVDGKEIILTKGKSFVVQPLVKHTFWAVGEENVEVKLKITFPTDQKIGFFDDTFFENFYGTMRDTKNNPNPIGLMYKLLENDVYLAEIPLSISKLLQHMLRLVAPIMGFKVHHEEYTTNYNVIQ
ncbi:polyketide synthase [Acrasis kona]|uniref:Polyketide synthase n=1 Tax=Acrasis kona TaxID=1008807 RepID=A0AAW2Z155_9EUKA